MIYSIKRKELNIIKSILSTCCYCKGGSQNLSDEQLLDKTTGPSYVPDNLYMHNMSVIEDPNAGKLAAIYTPDVIISASALKCIMDNFYPGFSRAWEIPVYVQEIKGSKPAETKRVIFIGKRVIFIV